MLYREVVSRYRPDIVIVALFVGNDVTDNSIRLTRAPRIYFDLDGEDGVRRLPFSALDRAGLPASPFAVTWAKGRQR